MKALFFRTNNRVLRLLGASLVVLLLVGCDPDLVFENEYDPEADNSPLGTSITNLYTNAYSDEFTGKTVEFGWDRVPKAISYEYEIVRIGWRDDTAAEMFREVASGTRELEAEGTVAQTAEGNDPQEVLPSDDGVYAIRVRYEAFAENNGERNAAWSPWSPPIERGVGAELYYWRTDQLNPNELLRGGFDFRGDRYVFDANFQGQGAGGNTMFLYIDDEFSGYENGADPYVRVYDAENSFDGPFFEGGFDFNKMENPLTFTMPPSEQLYIMLESNNPDFTEFEIRIEY